jgi:cysteine-S-conjugate beta-lyase
MTTLDIFEGVTESAVRARRGAKWTKHGDEVLAAWVADMDFPVAPPIRRAVVEAAECSAFGYARQDEQQELFAACRDWLASRHGWSPDVERFLGITDVVQGIHVALHQYTEPGDGVIVQGPIYPPFLRAVEEQGRRVVDNRMVDPTGAATFDLDNLRTLAADPGTKLLLLCNPHNPSGRVLTRAELETIAAIAVEHDLIVLSDEIWMDIVYPGHTHIPFQTLGPEVAARTVTMTSATKSFNLGGIRCAVAIFGSPELQARFEQLPAKIRGAANCLAQRATIAAWTDPESRAWFEAALRQLEINRDTVGRFVAERLPMVKHRTPEGTYLAWLDFSAAGLDRAAALYLIEHARVALNDGNDFGEGGHCARLNFATSPALLQEILERIESSLR